MAGAFRLVGVDSGSAEGERVVPGRQLEKSSSSIAFGRLHLSEIRRVAGVTSWLEFA